MKVSPTFGSALPARETWRIPATPERRAGDHEGEAEGQLGADADQARGAAVGAEGVEVAPVGRVFEEVVDDQARRRPGR